MDDPLLWLLAGAGTVASWLLRELVGSLVGAAVWEFTAPLRRPVWRVLVTASSPWPLLLLLGIGAATLSAGLYFLRDVSNDGFVGLWLLLAGVTILLVSPLLWRDARRERKNRGNRATSL